MNHKAIFIVATGQNVGKSTICLGLISGLKKRFAKVGFLKPVGQQHILTSEKKRVDKDVVLFKEYFSLLGTYEDMSPVIVPSGFTKDYLDGKVNTDFLKEKVLSSFQKIAQANDFTVVEGTGHVGVGSILDLNNAQAAALLGIDVVIVGQGGLGSTFDELTLNKTLCDKFGVKIRGIILNRVIEQKKEMIEKYMSVALKRWNIPIIGCVPFNRFLNTPAMRDFETLFDTRLISGECYQNMHFENTRLVATSVETFKEVITSNQLLVTPATREDIILFVIERKQHHMTAHLHREENDPEHGFILTGRHPPSLSIMEKLKKARIPSIYTKLSSFEAMRQMASFVAKIQKEDTAKITKAIELVESHLDFNILTKGYGSGDFGNNLK